MKIMKTILWIVLILAAIEGGLEVRARGRGYETILFGDPNRAGAGDQPVNPGFGPTRDFPFRSRLAPVERTDGVSRLWMASASYGEDIYVSPDLIFPTLLADYLTERGRPTEMLNASHAGESINSNTRELESASSKWRPDAAILYQMSLDIDIMSRRLLGQEETGLPGAPENGGEAVQDVGSGANVFVQVYERTTIFRTLKELIGGYASQQRILSADLGPEAAPRFREKVRRFVARCRESGVEPVLCTFASGYDVRNYRSTPVAIRNAVFRYNIYLSLEGWVKTIDMFNDVIRDVAAQTGVPLIDVAGDIGGRPEYFRDFIHFNRDGHAEVARLMADGLGRGGMSPQTPILSDGR